MNKRQFTALAHVSPLTENLGLLGIVIALCFHCKLLNHQPNLLMPNPNFLYSALL